MIKMRGLLIDKVDSMQRQMGNLSRKMEMLKRTKKKQQDFKKHCDRNKNAFDGLISKVDMDVERISELEDISIEPPILKIKENKDYMFLCYFLSNCPRDYNYHVKFITIQFRSNPT